MRKFLITVNGRKYEVEVEEVNSFAQPQAMQAQPAPQQPSAAAPAEPAQQPAAQKNEAAAAEAPSTGTKICAPMPGKIISVKVGPGQAVKRGDVLMILEAMKMENEIQAPVAGSITAIAVSEGTNVNAGALLACIG